MKNKTIYIKDGKMLEEVREILISKNQPWRMGYEAEDYPPGVPANNGYLYQFPSKERDNWYISKKLKDNYEVITLEEFKSL